MSNDLLSPSWHMMPKSEVSFMIKHELVIDLLDAYNVYTCDQFQALVANWRARQRGAEPTFQDIWPCMPDIMKVYFMNRAGLITDDEAKRLDPAQAFEFERDSCGFECVWRHVTGDSIYTAREQDVEAVYDEYEEEVGDHAATMFDGWGGNLEKVVMGCLNL